jgi:hypothetical protein
MGKRGLSDWCFIFLLFFILLCPSFVLSSQKEDTAHLLFQKTAALKENIDTYFVRNDDWVFNIIRKRFGGSEKEILKILDEVKRLNPEIENLDRVYPGQKLLLPQKDVSITTGLAREKDTTIKKTTTLDNAANVKNKGISVLGKKESLSRYTVREGDSISYIIQDQLGVSNMGIYRILDDVKTLNPSIEDLNMIYPGQKLLLPGDREARVSRHATAPIAAKQNQTLSVSGGKAKKGIISVPIIAKDLINKQIIGKKQVIREKGLVKKVVKKDKILSREKQILAIRYILSRINGSVITNGNYYIPLLSSGQITINCSAVPVIELDNGVTMLVDFSHRIPESLKRLIQSTWKKYSVVNIEENETIPSIIEKIINTSGDYSIKKCGTYLNVGNHPRMDIFIDWIVSEKVSATEKPYSFGIRIVANRSSLLPGSIRKYADESNFEVVELVKGAEIAGNSDRNENLNVPVLNSDTNMVLAEVLLSTLGYAPLQHSEVEIYSMEKDGFKVSVKVDLLLKINDKRVIINSKKISQEFVDVLKKSGVEMVFISDKESKKKVIEKVLHAVKIPFLCDDFKFSFSRQDVKNGGKISLPAIRINDNNGLLYFVDQKVDNGICGLLYNKRGVNLVKY